MPVQMQRAMAAEQEAYRLAKAKVNAALGELNSVKTLKDAADVLDQSEISLQLRYLQTLKSIVHDTRKSYIFPLPIRTLRKLFALSGKTALYSPPPTSPPMQKVDTIEENSREETSHSGSRSVIRAQDAKGIYFQK